MTSQGNNKMLMLSPETSQNLSYVQKSALAQSQANPSHGMTNTRQASACSYEDEISPQIE